MIVVLVSSMLVLKAQEGSNIYSTGLKLPEFLSTMVSGDVEGSPLAFDTWRKGSYINLEGDTSLTYRINYHTKAKQVFLCQLNDEEVLNLNESSVAYFLLENEQTNQIDKFHKIPWEAFKEYPDYDKFCLFLINEPNFQLIKYYDKEYIQAASEPNTLVGRTSDIFKPILRYYFTRNSTGFVELALDKKGLRAILNKEEEQAMKAYLKANKVKWNNEGEVVAMLSELITL